MNVRPTLCTRLSRLGLLSATLLTLALALPGASLAAPSGRSGERAARQAARAEERAARASERAALRARRSEQAQARRLASAERRASRERAGEHAAEAPAGQRPRTSGGEAPASEPVANARSYRGCRLHLEASAPRITAGGTATVSGKLLCAPGEAASPPPVALYERPSRNPLASFTTAASLTPGADGSFTLTSAPLYTNTVFQIRAGRRRARVAIKVAPLVTLVAAPGQAQSATAGGAHRRSLTELTGTVSPVLSGTRVALQVSYPGSQGRWHTIAYAHVSAAGSYATYHAFRVPGRASVRAVVHMRANAAGASEPLTYESAQPQNPRLTIEASADPVSFGQQITLSGIAAGAEGQGVQLLTRTATGASHVVATTTTTGGGRYSFLEQPLVSTRYQVRSASVRSTVLVVPVSFAISGFQPPAAATAGQPITFSGTLAPAQTGQIVYLERESASGVGFEVIASGTVGSSAQFTIEHSFEKAASVTLRILVPSDGGAQTTASPLFTLTVTPPAAPAS